MNKKIVLVSFYGIELISIRIIHAVLKKAGFEVTTLFLKAYPIGYDQNSNINQQEIDLLVDKIKEISPLFVGISVKSNFYKLAVRVNKEIKKKVKTIIIWGGFHPTINPEQSIKTADVICRGEGEEAMVEFAQKLSEGQRIDNIKNLWVKTAKGIIKNPLRPLETNLDKIPFPDFSLESKYIIENNNVAPLSEYKIDSSKFNLITVRGCPFNCTYCCHGLLRSIYNSQQYLRRRSPENVIKEILEYRKMFPELSYLLFWDDVFSIDLKWLKKFGNLYKSKINLPFFCYCHPSAVTVESIKLLKKMGGHDIHMGLQSGSEHVRRDYYDRFESNEEIIKAAKIIKRFGININYDLISENPMETNEDKLQTLQLLLRLPKPFMAHTYNLTNYPKTKLTRMLFDKKLITKKDVEDNKPFCPPRYPPIIETKCGTENVYWNNLYFLAGRENISESIIWWLQKSRFHKAYPLIITRFLKIIFYKSTAQKKNIMNKII